MRRLSDQDLENMAAGEFTPDDVVDKRTRRGMNLSRRIPPAAAPVPRRARLDLHQKTEEQAWQMICDMIASGVRDAVIITGASGILKIKFQQWARDSVISDKIISCEPLNNGSFAVKFRRKKCDDVI